MLEANAAAGIVPADGVAPVRAAPPPAPEAVAAIEAVTNHDVIAFLTAWADNTTPREAAAYVHFGMTSSDLLDTALALQLTEATDLLTARATALTAALRDHALAHRGTLRPGRTHGIHAEPDVWGHRVADFAFAMARCVDRLRRAREAIAVGKLSGPVGTYSSIDPAVEASVMAGLGLRPADVATQVVLRDGIAEWVSVLAIIATVCEAVALEVRHGQRTEVRELPRRSGRARRARRRCRTRRTRSAPSGSAGWPGSSGRRSCRCWRGSRSGTSGTSRTPRPSGSRCPTPRSAPTTCWSRRPA